MAELKNVFSWSKSRDEEFRECLRKYYYDRYQSWGGWDKRSPRANRDAYVLKNLKNRWAWKGETVHHEIEKVLKDIRAGRTVDPKDALNALTAVMRSDYKSSKTKRYWDEPKKTLGLFEHEYAKPVTDEVWKRMHDESADCLRNFFDSAFYAELLNDDKKSWLVIEDLEEYDFEGAKVYVKLDFARLKNGLYEIYDWKTGKNDAEGARLQIGTYAIYAMQKWGVPLEKVRAFLFNLSAPGARASEQPLDAALIEETKAAMRASIADMKRLLKDPKENSPLAVDAFTFTESDRLCDNCNFRKICAKFAV